MIRIIQSACFVSAGFAFALILSGCSPKESEQKGQELFDLHCAACHMGPTPDLKRQPPRLESLFAGKQLPSGAPATDTQVRKTIIEGVNTMPAFNKRLSDQDLDDLVEYLHTLK
jgi:mono/diheme cytochrome c family protein